LASERFFVVFRVSCFVVSLLLDVPLAENQPFSYVSIAEFCRTFSPTLGCLVAPSPFKAPEVAQRIHPSLSFFLWRTSEARSVGCAFTRRFLLTRICSVSRTCGGILFDISEGNECEISVPGCLASTRLLVDLMRETAEGSEHSN